MIAFILSLNSGIVSALSRPVVAVVSLSPFVLLNSVLVLALLIIIVVALIPGVTR